MKAEMAPLEGLTLRMIARVTGGMLVEAGAEKETGTVSPTGYSIDTRTLRPGDLFFAIVGPHHDGHRFVAEAVARGATGVVISDATAAGPFASSVPAIVVGDTLRALQDLAAHVRRSLPVKVVAITGSSGKTTTKEMTRQALEAAFKVHASRGNLNNLYGCPLAILELRSVHQISVLEMGMSYHGELARLAEIADPDIGILTNVSGAHIAHFKDLQDVASAKAELFAGMRPHTIGIFNNDDEHCRSIMAGFPGYAFTFAIDRPADLTAADYRMEGLEGSTFEVRHTHNGGTRRVRVATRFTGLHHVYNALAAMSAGYMLGIDLEAMAARLSELEPLGMRGRVLRLGASVRVLDESYNSNPAAMRFALKVLAEAGPAAAGGRKLVVFGEMLELGEGAVAEHRAIGAAIADSRPDVLIGVGPLAAEAVAAARSAAPGLEAHHLATAQEAAELVAATAAPGDLFLVKGSRGVALEKVVAALRERFGEE